MPPRITPPDGDLFRKLKWMMLFRLLFALLLLGGTIIYGANEGLSYDARPMVHIYWLTAWIILLSLCYTLVFSFFSSEVIFAYVQVGIDTLIATAIIFLTGSFASLFTFLYLIVIICASMLLSRKGSIIIAGLCCLEYGVMVDLEYYEIIRPAFYPAGYLHDHYEWSQVIYKMVTVMLACFLTLILSGYLAERERRAQSHLRTMTHQVRRMEQLAVVGEMAAGLAHEIKNPLASLSGSIQMLKESRPEDGDQAKLMTIALREAERLNGLVSDFLQFARPKKGKPAIIETARLIGDTLSLFENSEGHRGRVRVARRLTPDLWTEMDPDQLKQVILNLLLNAAESMGETGGTITVISFLHRDQRIRIKIIDEGTGMDEATLAAIFDPFFTTKSKGTGLGLSIVLRILQAYQYGIDVKSEKHTGSTFTLTLAAMPAPS